MPYSFVVAIKACEGIAAVSIGVYERQPIREWCLKREAMFRAIYPHGWDHADPRVRFDAATAKRVHLF